MIAVLLHCMSQVLAHSGAKPMQRNVRTSWCKRTCEAPKRHSGFDPSATLAVHCGNGFDHPV